ncbi:MAG: M48 family metalloprotease [Planctomycetota bacterium]
MLHSSHRPASCLAKRASAFMAAVGLTMTAIVGTGCETNPATGKRQFNYYSIEQEVQLGTELAPQLTQEYGGAVQDPQLTRYVERIGDVLAQQTEEYNTELPWEFTLLDSEIINAFALPGGKVFISAGLVTEMTNEAQLAGVLGHEIGHVTAQHTDQRVGTAMIVAGIATAAGVAAQETIDDSNMQQLAGLVIGAGGQGYLLSYSREQEIEADALGMRYMSRAGYNPIGQLQVMEILRDVAAGAGAPPEFLSTHPHPETRIREIERLLKTEYAYTQNSPEFEVYEDRFQRIVPARLAALRESRNNTRHAYSGMLNGSMNAIATAAFTANLRVQEHEKDQRVDFANPLTWCGVCQAAHHHHASNDEAAAVAGATGHAHSHDDGHATAHAGSE